ncbi:putative lipopolysaccharide biosynthesis protein [Nocardioides sp. CF8]|uniref:LPS biosynthesis protein n=1 Tax=Nocardioides sp. CF8 TaxID=110319 RepID=UPI00032DCD32|nr:LPS biosynthesis protein [Nocardioides sp. CF8]EON24839.1 putative lipopolysaccharide biosynthesis protein [Nocardioides sp. CF8]
MTGPIDGRRAEVADFRRRWHRFARRWRAASLRDLDEARTLLDKALTEGLPPVGDADPAPPPPAVQVACARAVVAASGFLDADDYTVQHRLRRGTDPVRHFVDEGWRSLRTPSLRFDLWTYWTEHLDPTDDTVNPLLHYLLRGRHDGLAALPTPAPTRPPTIFDGPPRRACLFAGYDRDGLVDATVVAYLTELSRHADVFYLADGVLEPGELAKLDGVVKGAWSVPHGAYDFGSFSLLARDLVGWERLADYDEVVLANDSCYLLRPLDGVFAEMDTRACDWWSLQATSMEHDESYISDDSPIPLAEAKQRLIGPRHWTDDRFVHLSSYFLAFRRPVLDDPGFRWRLDTVTQQQEKRLVIHKYEVGISRYLLDAGFDFDTLLPDLWAFHPLYGRHFFELVERGFPLVKRNYLGENPRHVAGLEQWEERLRPLVPDAPFEAMRAHLERVTAPAMLREAYGARLADDGRRQIPLRATQGYGLRRLDRETPTFAHWWAFPVAATGRLDPGLRAVFEEVRTDPSVHKVVLTRGRPLADELTGERVTVLPMDTPDGQAAMVRCGLMLTDETPDVTYPFSFPRSRHDHVHLGVGLPHVPGPHAGDWGRLEAVAACSPGEALARAATLPDLDLARLWLTGLPRHDHLLLAPELLPADLRAQEERLRAGLAGRPLVVWWVRGPARALPSGLADWAREHDVVVGVREPRVDRADGWTRALLDADLPRLIGLSDRSVTSPVPVHRVASAIVTDDDPHALDALVTGVPLLRLTGSDDQAAAADHGWAQPTSCPDEDALRARLTELALAGFPRREVTVPDGAPPLDGAAARRFVHRLRLLRRR